MILYSLSKIFSENTLKKKVPKGSEEKTFYILNINTFYIESTILTFNFQTSKIELISSKKGAVTLTILLLNNIQ